MAANAAVPFDDYLAQGFTVMRATTTTGSFTGCTRGKSLSFADGTRFQCGRTQAGAGPAARVYILRHDADGPSVVLIDGRAFTGSLSRLGTTRYATPVIISAADAADQPSGTNDPDRIAPVEAIYSINTLTAQGAKRLNDVQLALPHIAGPKRPGIDQ